MTQEFAILTDRLGNQFQMRPWHCPTCGEGPTKRVGLRGGRHQRDQNGVETAIVSCDQCGLLFPQPFPIPLDPQRLYGDPSEYFAMHDLDTKVAGYRKLVRELLARSGSKPCSLLDIGAGRGDLLYAARLEGCDDTVGLEFSHAMIQFAKKRFDIELLEKTAEALAEERPGSFDAVVLNAVIEHVHDPLSLMRSVAKLCRPRALIYIDVPREPHLLTVVANAWNKLRGRDAVLNLQPTWPPFHVYGFNPQALRALLSKTGFVVESIRIHASPHVEARPGFKGQLAAKLATQINHLANRVAFSSNMYVFARRR